MTYRFDVASGAGEPREGTVGKKGDVCLLTGSPMTREHIRLEAKAGRMGVRLMAIVAEGRGGRVFLLPDEGHERIAAGIPVLEDIADTDIVGDSRYLTPTSYGMTKYRDLYTSRQLLALGTFCALFAEARMKLTKESGGDPAYADAV